ncbi:MAG: hypothetical protein ABIO70_06060 [Pseudomonadota bacterium]
MRPALLCLPLALLCACPSAEDSEVDDTGPDDSDTEEIPPVYPDGTRILLFHGHGGPSEDESGWGRFTTVDTHWKDAYGWNSDYRTAIPDDLSDYRAVFFIAPGYTGEEDFTAGELDLLRGALDAGTRMIVVNERDGCGTSTPNILLAALGASLAYTGDGQQIYQTAETDLITPHQITAGVSQIKFRDTCWVDPGEGRGLVEYQRDVMVAVERPGAGGEVVLIGDFEFLDDSGPQEWADNALFVDRLVEIDPAFAE